MKVKHEKVKHVNGKCRLQSYQPEARSKKQEKARVSVSKGLIGDY
jgi:hypothetical protein